MVLSKSTFGPFSARSLINLMILTGSTAFICRRQPRATRASHTPSGSAVEGVMMCCLGRETVDNIDNIYTYLHISTHRMQPVRMVRSMSTVSGGVQGW